jgi:hypothetical protein
MKERLPLSIVAGGVLCEACRPSRRGVVSVSNEVIQTLRAASAIDETESGMEPTELGRPGDFAINPSSQGELRAVMSNYFAHLVGHRLRMSEYLGASGS